MLRRAAVQCAPTARRPPGLNARTVRYVHTILHAVLKDALTLAVSERGLEPLRPIRAPGPQPGASAYSATPTWPFKSSQSDRKSTRLNSSHANISYAVFCL